MCHGVNQLKSTKGDAELIAFVKNRGEQRTIGDAEITTKARGKIGDMPKGKLTVEYYIR